MFEISRVDCTQAVQGSVWIQSNCWLLTKIVKIISKRANLICCDIKIEHPVTEMAGVFQFLTLVRPGPGCSKLKISLVNVLLTFQKLISEIIQYFLLKKM